MGGITIDSLKMFFSQRSFSFIISVCIIWLACPPADKHQEKGTRVLGRLFLGAGSCFYSSGIEKMTFSKPKRLCMAIVSANKILRRRDLFSHPRPQQQLHLLKLLFGSVGEIREPHQVLLRSEVFFFLLHL